MKNLLFLAVFLLQPLFLGLYPHSDPIQTKKEQQTLQYEVAVTLKLVQVYVTDKKGNPVVDLKKEDFIIYDKGKKQSITEFERHILHLPYPKTEIQPEVIQESPIPPSRELMSRKFFLLFDFAYNNAKGILKARKAALHFIDTKLQSSDEVGVLSYSAIKSLKLHEYLTTDHEKVREVVESFGLKEIHGRAENFEVEYWRQVTGENPLDASKRGGVFMGGEDVLDMKSPGSQKFLSQQDSRFNALNFIQKMTDLAKALRYILGYKHIILFSSGIPYSLIYGIQSQYRPRRQVLDLGDPLLRPRCEDMLKELAASNSTVYTLDTEDLATKIGVTSKLKGGFTLQTMASSTGGKYFGNINSYEKHLEKIQNLTGCYYVLGFYIDEKWDGKYHKIKVKVNRPGCKVHAQKGYFNPKPFSEYSKLEKMFHLVDLALSEKPLYQTPVYFPLAALPCSIKGEPNLALFSKIPMEKIQEFSGKEVEIVSIIFDEDDNIVKIERDEKDFSKLPKGNIYYSS
ncbi:MAG: VWA domain-containing protein, partial [Candidatus Aminicenantes bacterium]|nr:VWA domain-containing protein [Candidatus Aminicenantes bacterium]